jgi:hypothetical protein
MEDIVAKRVQIILSVDNWQLLGDELLEVLPEPEGTITEVILLPSENNNPKKPTTDDEHMYSELKSLQARLQAHYPHLVFTDPAIPANELQDAWH